MTPFRSAQAINGMIASLSQEVFRTQANCNFDVTPEERRELVEDFCSRLKQSGYPVKLAELVVRSGLKNYITKVDKARKRKAMFHRPEEEGRLMRRRTKLTGKTSWFRKNNKNNVDQLKNVHRKYEA